MAAVYLNLRGYQPARFFLVAWATFLVGALVYGLQKAGLLPRAFVTEYMYQIGTAAEVVLLSLALGDRINHLQKQVLEEQASAVAEQIRISRSLERFVPKQIFELLGRRHITEVQLGDATARPRIEDLTKVCEASILISQDTLVQLADPGAYRFRVVDQVRVRGKREPVTVVEVFDGQSDYLLELFEATRSDFDKGVNAFLVEDFERAADLFAAVLARNPNDRAAQIYLERSREFTARPAGSSP